jgi:transposase InsO family protein
MRLRSLKEECVWLHNFGSFTEARAAITKSIQWYNARRPHQAFGYRSPRQFRALLAAYVGAASWRCSASQGFSGGVIAKIR